MTYTEAIQEVLKKRGVKETYDAALQDLNGDTDFQREAAELWQAENLKEIERLQNVGIGFVNRIEKQRQRVEELEAGLKKIANTSDDAPQMMRVIAKQLLK